MKSRSDFWDVLLYLIEIFGFWLGLGFILNTIEALVRKYREYKSNYVPCPHGIRGGKNLRRCAICVREEEEYLKQLEEKRREAERKAEIAKKAEQLRREEVQKIININLRNRSYLQSLSPKEFEDVIAIVFQNLGYEVKQTPYSNDQGKDAIAFHEDKKYLIECKHYDQHKTVGRPQLQKFFAAMVEEKADGGFVVTTGKFTNTAIKYAKNKNITLIDLDQLIRLIEQALPRSVPTKFRVMCPECGEIIEFTAKETTPFLRCTEGHFFQNTLFELLTVTPKFQSLSRYISNKKYCEQCGREMRVIDGRRGKFWGCTGYPTCKNTEPYEEDSITNGGTTHSKNRMSTFS